MAILLKCGAIFLHIPKTGGSWVTRTLRDQDLIRKEFGHIHADMVRVRYYAGGTSTFARTTYEWGKSLLPRKLKANKSIQRLKKTGEQAADARFPFTFCFVRHPLHWYESWWRYMCGRSGADWTAESDLTSWHPCGALREMGDPDFVSFVDHVNTKHPGFATELFGSYTQTPIQFVGRQENLTDDLVHVLTLLNVRFDEQRLRESSRVNVSQGQQAAEWTKELWDRTARLEYAGLVRFGYVDHESESTSCTTRLRTPQHHCQLGD